MEKHKGGMKELLQFEHFQLKIEADTNGLKVFTEAHGRHIQKGPDVLIISTPDYNLNFKTTFTPGPGAGQDLHCIIAGELIRFVGMDFTPKNWRAFADRLIARNNARIIKMEKGTKRFIEKTLKAQRGASEKARLEYEKSGDPEIVIGFIKRSPSAAPLNEPWVIEAMQKWIKNDRYDLVKSLCPRRGERSDPRTRAIEGMMFVEKIDKHRRAGKPLKKAFISEAERTGGGNLTGDDLERELTALKNKYHRAKRIKTEITVQKTAESSSMTAFPAKITVGDFAMFGEWTYKFPKK